LVFLAITVFAQRHQRMFVADGQTDGFAIARMNIALLGNVRQKFHRQSYFWYNSINVRPKFCVGHFDEQSIVLFRCHNYLLHVAMFMNFGVIIG